MHSERDLAREFTGMVAAGIAVSRDLDAGSATCSRCDGDATLTTGDRVTATVSNYDNHTWELLGLYCEDHPVASVEGDMDVAGVDQAVIEATLEPTGYRDPQGGFHPAALTLGGISVLDYSPAGDGYS